MTRRYIFFYTAVVLLVLFTQGVTLDSLLGCIFSSCLLSVAVIDARTKTIPFSVNMVILGLGIVRTVLCRSEVSSHIFGFFAISTLLYMVYLLSDGAAIGGGDIKLMAVAGLFLGWEQCTFGFLAGGIMAVVIHLIRMCFFSAEKEFALGPYLAAGLYVVYLCEDGFVKAALEKFL